MKNILLKIIILFSLLSCKENKLAESNVETSILRIKFDNIAGDSNLILDSGIYYNHSKEDIIVTKFDYYISNIKLSMKDGRDYVVPQDSSYFLIREDNQSSQLVTLNSIPIGDYDGIEFMIGIDSLRNTMNEAKRTGVLDPGGFESENEMYWAWNSGYIFVKVEGISTFGNPTNNKFYYHIGLFGGYSSSTVNNTRIVKLKFGNDAVRPAKNNTSEILILTDVLKFFDGTGTNLSISSENAIMAAPVHWALTAKIADNYQQMFSYGGIR